MRSPPSSRHSLSYSSLPITTPPPPPPPPPTITFNETELIYWAGLPSHPWSHLITPVLHPLTPHSASYIRFKILRTCTPLTCSIPNLSKAQTYVTFIICKYYFQGLNAIEKVSRYRTGRRFCHDIIIEGI